MFNFFGVRKSRHANRNLIYNLVSYEKVRDMIYDSDNILIDVRSPNEYNILHVINAVNIPVSKLRFCENEYKEKKAIILYCSSGIRTKEAIMVLNGMGYTNLYIWEYGSLSNFPYKDMLKI